MLRTKKRMLVVTADGGTARSFEGSHVGGALIELEDRRLTAPPPPSVSKPSRVHDRFGPARHSIESRQSPRVATEARFLKQVAEAIAHGLDGYDEVVLCAPPRALGVLRQHLPQAVRDRLSAELAKDYVRETPERLSALLADAIS